MIDLEADLRARRITPRRAMALAKYLPPGAMTWLEAGADAAWGVSEYILADLYDLTVAAHSDEKGRKSAKPYPRPAARREQEAKETQLEARALAFRERNKNRPAPPPADYSNPVQDALFEIDDLSQE